MTDQTGSTLRLVVNADDFGMNESISRGILAAHASGIVTSTSVIGNCLDPAGVKTMLDQAPNLGVGAHLTLVGGNPVSRTSEVSSLLTADSTFPEHARDIAARWAKGVLRPTEIELELDAQIKRLIAAGLRLDHIDTHRHIGFLPVIGRILETLARRHGIPGIRMAVEHPSMGWLAEARRGALAATLGTLAWVTRRGMGALRHGPQTWGYVESGRLDQVRILEIVGRLGPGAHELICHPGEIDDEYLRKRELEALTSPRVRDAIARRGVTLCRWADLF